MIRPASRRSLPALAGLLALILAACSSAASSTPLPSGAEPPSDCVRVESGVLELSAQDLEFSAPCMVAVTGEPRFDPVRWSVDRVLSVYVQEMPSAKDADRSPLRAVEFTIE